MAENAGIDPRYAAQFQRGYDPTTDAAPSRRGPVRLEGGPPATAAPVPDPPPLAERHPVEPAVRAEPEPDDHPPAPRSRLEWALLGAGVALLVAAGALFVGAVQQFDRDSGWLPGFENQLYGAATDQLPGPLLVAGVLAIVTWIVLRAISADRRSR
ncbi:MAG: hypothetical protein WBL06_04785 [Pseudolysinimonas sp.]|uniref:hypothetical protein n=1 Tax=Pseudolysinimonas sp. TaxID=2680009 RepID=UPI003C72F836